MSAARTIGSGSTGWLPAAGALTGKSPSHEAIGCAASRIAALRPPHTAIVQNQLTRRAFVPTGGASGRNTRGRVCSPLD